MTTAKEKKGKHRLVLVLDPVRIQISHFTKSKYEGRERTKTNKYRLARSYTVRARIRTVIVPVDVEWPQPLCSLCAKLAKRHRDWT